METSEEACVGYNLIRTQRLNGAEIWNVRASEDWETIGQAFVIYPEYDACQIMLAIEPEHMEESDDILELLVDTLGVDEFICSVTEWKEDIYSEETIEELDEEFVED